MTLAPVRRFSFAGEQQDSDPVDKRHDGPDSRHHAVKNTPHPVQGEKKISLRGKQMRGVVVRHFVVSGHCMPPKLCAK